MKRRYAELLAWQKAHRLTIDMYRVSLSYPKDEQYGLVSQIRRAASSIPANIVEGHSRSSTNEFKHFLSIARGSAVELDYFLLLSKDLGYLEDDIVDQLCMQCDDVIRLITALMVSLK